MKTTSYAIHARFFMLLKQLPFLTKEELVWEHSGMLTESLSEYYRMNPAGYNLMIRDMQQTVDNMKQPQKQTGKQQTSEVTKRLRSGVLHRLQKHGVDTTKWDKVNAFLEQPRIAGKRLYDMSDQELIDLIPKLESILKKDKQHEAVIERMTLMN